MPTSQRQKGKTGNTWKWKIIWFNIIYFWKRKNNQPVQQWLGVIVGITIALLLTLPLPLPYCVGFLLLPQCAIALCIVQGCMSCHCDGGCIAHCAMAFFVLPCKGMPWQCSWGHGIVICSMALCIMLLPCTLCCSIFVPWYYASCCGILHHVKAFSLCCSIAFHATALKVALHVE